MGSLFRTISLASAFLASSLSADLDQDLKGFFEKFNSDSTVNAPDAYQGQLAGHVTGGSASLRNRVVDTKLAHVSLPSVNAGCGGIDIYSGGFSFISKDELVNTLKSIGSNALGYSFLLALETVSPQIANNVKQLQTWANTINSVGINSCEVATQLVGAVWPRQTEAHDHICRSVGMKSGQFNDFISARHNCGNSQNSMVDNGNSEGFQDLFQESYNVAWEVLKKQSALQKNLPLRKLFMSLTGTVVISRTEQGGFQVNRYDSKVFSPDFINTLLHGGTTKGYTCTDPGKNEKCLMVEEDALSISAKEAWQTKMQNILLAIQDKIFADQPLNQDEIELINSTQFPLFKIINVLSAYSKGRSPVDLYQCSSIVATDLLCQFIREVIQLARESAQALRTAQVNAEPIDEFIENLREVESKVKELEIKNASLIDQEFKLIQKIELIEEKLRSQLKI